MKIKKQRIISILLAMLMLISVIPVGTITVSAATLNLSQLKAKFPHGKYWNHVGYSYNNENGYTSSPCPSHLSTSTCNAFTYNGTKIGWQCFGFACKLGYDAYGSNPKSWGRAYNLNNIKAGDIINYDGNNPGHTVFVTKVSGDTVYFAECNYGGRCLIRWDRSLKKSQFNNLFNVYVAPSPLPDGPHICEFTGSYFESTHPHKVYQKCSCGKTKYTGATKAYQNCSTCMKLSTAYVMPVKAYTINTGKTTVYNAVNGTAKSNKIYDTDLCTISQIYDCGWCKVTFPLDKGGTETGYCKVSVFMKGGGFYLYTSKQINTYRRSDLKTSIGYAGSGDKIYILGTAGSAVQIAYPLNSSTWKVGWVPTSAIKCTISYNANGGSGSMANSSAQYKGSFTLAANKFTKTGHTFSGWNAYRASDKKWYVSGEGWKTASEISTKGYSEKLYNNKCSGTLGQAWIISGKTNDTFSFYAVWTPNKLNVTYNANGGTISSDTYKLSNNLVYKKANNEKLTQIWTYNQTKKNGLYNAASFGLSREGYTFKGWGTTASGGTVFDQNDAKLVPSSINFAIKNGNCSSTLYAIWTPNTCNVSYNANGGTISSDTYKLSNNLVYKKANNEKLTQIWTYNQTQKNGLYNAAALGLSREGYTFKGWGTTASGGTVFDENDAKLIPTSINSAIKNGNCSSTLYAIWTPNTVTIKTGDINNDGDVNITDATMIQKYLVNLIDFTKEQIIAADTNGDGDVNINDATNIQKYIVQLINNLG